MFTSPSSNGSRRDHSRYRSRRAVKSHVSVAPPVVTRWTRAKVAIVCCGVGLLAMTTVVPIFMLGSTLSSIDENKVHKSSAGQSISLHSLIDQSLHIEQIYQERGMNLLSEASNRLRGAFLQPYGVQPPVGQIDSNTESPEEKSKSLSPQPDKAKKVDNKSRSADTANENVAAAAIEKMRQSSGKNPPLQQPLARGVSGLPMSKTPALIGAQSGHGIECDVNVDDIIYWNDPQGERDQKFVSPFATGPDHYLTFEPDRGGWNNIRMSMEIIFVMAAVTGRTLVLPPKSPFYLLGIGKKNVRSFGDFYNLDHPEFQKRVKVITMSEFLEKERHGLLNLSDEEYEKLKPVADTCLHGSDSPINCLVLYDYLRDVGVQPAMEAMDNCLIFDLDHFQGKEISEDLLNRTQRFCTDKRKAVFYDKDIHDPQLIHWNAGGKEHRLLNHFYGFLYFSDPRIDNYYKRFVRDFLHYKDNIYCAAGKIIHALNEEANGKSWSALHVRRGDLQYKAVKISAEEWYNNTKEIWMENEILFIATDERNKTFFDPIKPYHDIRFLEDYWDLARLGDLESNYLGMVDTIVASNGRAFAGTWFSTFTGYINRMRGYLGHSMTKSWYSWLPRKDAMQEWKYIEGNIPAREWPLGWTGIDGDEWIEHELEPVDSHATDVFIKVDFKKPKDITLEDLIPDNGFQDREVSRGIAGRPMSETPALEGAQRGHIECDINVDSLAYWNSPQGERDVDFVSPFANKEEEKYISFSSDQGGWNNVRMSMEIIFVIAAATGRTLVLPPKTPLYRLRADKKNIYRGFADFYPLHDPEFNRRVKIITMEEFVKREGGADGRLPIPDDMISNAENIMYSSQHCDRHEGGRYFCGHVSEYLKAVGYSPDVRAQDGCFLFDEDVFEGRDTTIENAARIAKACGKRKIFSFTKEIQEKPLIHFRAGEKDYRLLTHFYNFVHFTDPLISNYYKRFVRDFLRYQDPIYCAAGKIVKALQLEAAERGFETDGEGAGSFSSMHVRRGDLQYKKVKISAEEWYDNTKELWMGGEILYIATDERNKTFFNPIAEHHDVRFLDDYFELAGLGNLDPNWFGMIDTIVASRGRVFAGTFFSTFTGFINRLRGYEGLSMQDSWYSWLPRKEKMHTWENINDFAYAFEWPDGWVGIDSDVLPTKDTF